MRLEIFFKIGFSLKSNDFDFEIVNFPFLDGDVPRSPSYGVYISQLIRLRECVLILMISTTEPYF